MILDHIFLKIAASSLDLAKALPIELAAIRTDGNGTILASCTDKLSIGSSQVSDDASKLYRYSVRDWQHAVPFSSVHAAIESSLLRGRTEKVVIVGHFAEVDRLLWTNACKASELSDPFSERAWIDLAQLLWPLTYSGQITGRSLVKACEFYGVEKEESESPAYEVEAIRKVYFKVMARWSLLNNAEQKVKTWGGNLVSKFMGGM